jgi:uncharacterized membrane protein
MSLDPTPLSINIFDNKATLTMPSGEITVSYLLGTVGTRENALLLINEAEAVIEDALAENVKVGKAEILLQQARGAYDEGQYNQAEQLASQAKDSAVETMSLAQEAGTAMDLAEASIASAQDAGRISLLDQATQQLQQAREYYDAGEYGEAKTSAEKASDTALQSKSTKGFLTPQILLPLGAVLVVALIILFKLTGKRPRPVSPRIEERVEIDLDHLFTEKPELRLDEKEVLRFIAETGGGAFASEIRDRFDLPRSSAWRMIRRLEEDEIVETNKVGRETHVQISPKYALKRAEEG